MNKPKIKVTILKEHVGYSAHALVQNKFIATEAESFDGLLGNLLEAVNLTFENKGISYTIDELKFSYDLSSFFEYYKVINAKALSERIGMNQSLLAQYIHGIKKPSASQIKRILTGIQQVGKELADVQLIF
jgi:transcriptional regulator with XRE-family HTH domain